MKKKQRPTPSPADSTEVVKKLDEASKVDTILKQKKTHKDVSNMNASKIREAIDWCAISRQLTNSTASNSSAQSRTFLMTEILQKLFAKCKNENTHPFFASLDEKLIRRKSEYSESARLENLGLFLQLLWANKQLTLSIQFQGVFFALQSNPLEHLIYLKDKVDELLYDQFNEPREIWTVTRIDIAQDWNMPVAELLPDPHTDKSVWYTWKHRRAPHSRQNAKGEDIYTGFSLITERLVFRVYDKKRENQKVENNESKVKFYDNLFAEYEHVSRCEIEIKSARECLFATNLLAHRCDDESEYIRQCYLNFRRTHNLRVVSEYLKTRWTWPLHHRWEQMFPETGTKIQIPVKNYSKSVRVKDKDSAAQELIRAVLLFQGASPDSAEELTVSKLKAAVKEIKATLMSQIKTVSKKEIARFEDRQETIKWLKSLKKYSVVYLPKRPASEEECSRADLRLKRRKEAK